MQMVELLVVARCVLILTGGIIELISRILTYTTTIAIMTTICKQIFCCNFLNQARSLCTIRCAYNKSDWHTKHIHD